MVTNAKQPLRAVFYTRQSLDKSGEELGIQRQLETCQALAAQLGWTIADDLGNRGPGWFDDNDVSAMGGKTRPGFEALLDAMKRGEVDGLICWHPDRLYRRLADLALLLDVSPGVEIQTVNGGEIDLSHSTGRMLATILGSVATQESEHKAERQRAAAVQLAKNGKPKWRKSFGYVTDTRDKRDDDGKRQLDPVAAPLVRAAYEAVVRGEKITAIAASFNAAGMVGGTGKPWTASTMSLFLRNPRNAGLRAYNRKVVGKGQWEPLVDEETWQAAQTVLARNVHGPKSVRKHLLTGVLRCGKAGCDGHLSGNWVRQAGNPNAKRAYAMAYACKTCRGVSVRADHVERLLRVALVERLSRRDAAKLLRKTTFNASDDRELRNEERVLRAKLAQLGKDFASAPPEFTQAALADVQGRLDDLALRQQDQDRRRVLDGIPLGTDEVGAAIDTLTPDRYRAVWGLLATITVAPVGKGGHTFNPDRIDVAWR